MIVDLPTPDEPRNAAVRPGPMCRRSASRPCPERALTSSTGTCPATGPSSVAHLPDVPWQVGLVEDDDGSGAALQRRQQVALDPPQVEVVIEAADEEHDVHVGGDHLRLGGGASGFTHELAATGEDLDDATHLLVGRGRLQRDPVANGGEVLARAELVPDAARHARQHLRLSRVDAVDVLALERHAGRAALVVPATMCRPDLGPAGIPPEDLQCRVDGHVVSLDPAAHPNGKDSCAALPTMLAWPSRT